MTLKSYDDLAKLASIGVPRGVAFEPRFDADTKLNKVEQTDSKQSIRMVAAGRLDGAVGSAATFALASNSLGITGDLGDQLELTRANWWVVAKKGMGQTEEAKKIATALKSMREDGTMNAIIMKNGGGSWYR